MIGKQVTVAPLQEVLLSIILILYINDKLIIVYNIIIFLITWIQLNFYWTYFKLSLKAKLYTKCNLKTLFELLKIICVNTVKMVTRQVKNQCFLWSHEFKSQFKDNSSKKKQTWVSKIWDSTAFSNTRKLSDCTFLDRWIGRSGAKAWPPAHLISSRWINLSGILIYR